MKNSTIARISAAEDNCRINKSPEPTLRLTYNDNSVRNVGALEALISMTVNYSKQPPNMQPIKAEVINGYEKAPKLCDTVIYLCEMRHNNNMTQEVSK